MSNNSNRPERPRLEPEIIPPRYDRRDGDWLEGGWSPYASGASGTQRIYFAKFGPFGLAMVMLVIGFVAAIVLLATVGALLIWLPIGPLASDWAARAGTPATLIAHRVVTQAATP